MHFSFRQAAATLLLCSLTFTAAGKPGLALMLDKPATAPLATTNLPAAPSVPAQDALTPQISASDDAEAPVRYASLAEAIDAQSPPEAPDEELRCLAGAIYFEAKGEPLTGQLGVAQVILNRTKSGRFPRTICSVVKQRGQFAFLEAGEMPAIPDNGHYRTALGVAQVALQGAWESPVADALFFHASRVSPSWGKRRVAAIGGHVFYR